MHLRNPSEMKPVVALCFPVVILNSPCSVPQQMWHGTDKQLLTVDECSFESNKLWQQGELEYLI